MKKWIIFFVCTCAICAIVFGFEAERLNDLISGYKFRIQYNGSLGPAEEYIPYIIRVSVSMFLLLTLFIFSTFILISISLGKLPTINIKENLAQYKATRQQRKLEKAQAKVEKLKENIEKDA